MAKKVDSRLCGIDVSKRTLDIALEGSQSVSSIVNSVEAIDEWLRDQAVPLRIGLEATSTYHDVFVEQALLQGHTVYLVNPKQLKHYREAVGVRAKTDSHDALLLRRYLAQEGQHLRPLSLRNTKEKQLWQLLKRRGSVVKMRQRLRQSCEDLPNLGADVDQLVRSVGQLLKKIDRELMKLAKALKWQPLISRVSSIPGLGPLNGLALTACYHRGEFRSVDAFIAFIGLDVRVRDSGSMRGKRKLTKQGEPELRRLLYNAAMSFDRNVQYRPYRESLMARGLSSTAAYVVIARKLARVAFTLLRKNVEFDDNVFTIPCKTT